MYEFRPPPAVIEPTPRRIRVRRGNKVVADSTRALLLDEIGEHGFPTYFFPADDVLDSRAAAKTDDRFDELKGHVTFSWTAFDWYEEDEQVFVHARSPRHRVDTLYSSRRVQVFIDGQEVANSVRPVLLFETSLPTRYYLPFADVRTELLTASATLSRCPYKGVARYWSHPALADAAWSYPEPIGEIPKIRDLLCFYDERVDVVLDGEPQPRPVTPFT